MKGSGHDQTIASNVRQITKPENSDRTGGGVSLGTGGG